MKETLIQDFIKLISSYTGLQIRIQDRETLCKKIWLRIKILKLNSPEAYYQLLNSNSEASEKEWRELELQLTTVETYFFRDRGQFSLLRNQILPELIEQRQQERSLRIWSAGCSTGEEPYSLAILIKELLPNYQDWNIFILGTDLNIEVLEKAKRGIYNPWSFRMVDNNLKNNYFLPYKNELKIDEKIRKMVTYHYGNLVNDFYPSSLNDIHSMDLIVCRNVFIYFDNISIASVLKKFYHTLNPGGYLLAGHTELHGQDLGQLQSVIFPESVIYKRSKNPQKLSRLYASNLPKNLENQPKNAQHDWMPDEKIDTKEFSFSIHPQNQIPQIPNTILNTHPLSVLPPNVSTPTTSYPSQNTQSGPNQPIITSATLPQTQSAHTITAKNYQEATQYKILIEAEKLFQQEAYPEAIKKAEEAIILHPSNFGAYSLLARAYANIGEYTKANHYCQQALALDSFSVVPYYVLAHLAEEQGNIEQAKMFLKRIIYLAPFSIAAYLELGSIYEQEGDNHRAQKMRHTALELLQQLPTSTVIEQQGGMTADELLVYVKKLLRNPNK